MARPPLPPKPALPLPATVMMLPTTGPVAWGTSRTTLFRSSAMNRSPAESRARPRGLFSSASVGLPPSPL